MKDTRFTKEVLGLLADPESGTTFQFHLINAWIAGNIRQEERIEDAFDDFFFEKD